MLSNKSSCAGHTVRPNKLKRQSLEQRNVYCRAKQGDQAARAQKPQTLSREKFL